LNLGASVFVIARAGQREKGAAMGEFTAGLFAGSLCGCAAGGLMADRLGFGPVFYAAAFIFLVVWTLILTLFPKDQPGQEAGEEGPDKLGFKTLLGFASDRRVLNMGLSQVLPAAIVSVGLLNYFLPIHMGRIGAGPSAVGQLNILFSLTLVFLGPRFGRAIDASRRKYAYLALGGLFAAAATSSFFLAPALAGALIGILFLGLSHAISENGHPAYLLQLPAAKRIGVGPSISLYSSLIRIGQALGPLTIAAALSRGGLKGLVWVGGAMVAINLLFALTSRQAEAP
jgi:predicted MFS family arabinose efflux permease